MTKSYWIKDLSLSGLGRKKIYWAEQEMPILTSIRERFSVEKPLKNLKIGACLHITKETAVLVRTLREAGAEVYLCASNPLSTQDDVAAALVDEGFHVFGWRGMSQREYYECIGYVLSSQPNITIDDGADLVSSIHKLYYNTLADEISLIKNITGELSGREILKNIMGGSEETTTGVYRLKSLAREGKLLYPIIAVNDALSKSLFDNPIGTGQSAIDGVIRATNTLIAGKDVVVVGFGRVGSGIASRCRGLGARVTIVEVDPINALRAAMDGFRVESMLTASKHGEIFITATGNINVIRREHFQVMKDGVILANAGHFDVEICKKDLEELSKMVEKTSDHITTYVMEDGRRLHLLGDGRLVNLACAEGHPSSVMDMSFSLQALSAEYIVKNFKNLPREVIPVPREIDLLVARLKLKSMGLELEEMTEEQKRYLESWYLGT
ncbi:MAG: adenosylhomocysteinase [Aigarchaeota archaeon]|nr:adenosylhomocysteinase [Aigarchaeota archaeon]MCX8193458.1 adenosylhomocysteinase [Nitrososphaeria archaeon]MDW7985810.1 adenosylhomocysteinase [Nitrososphaerota archaeon]